MMPRGWEAGKPAGLGDRVTIHLRRHLFKTPSLPAISGRAHTLGPFFPSAGEDD